MDAYFPKMASFFCVISHYIVCSNAFTISNIAKLTTLSLNVSYTIELFNILCPRIRLLFSMTIVNWTDCTHQDNSSATMNSLNIFHKSNVMGERRKDAKTGMRKSRLIGLRALFLFCKFAVDRPFQPQGFNYYKFDLMLAKGDNVCSKAWLMAEQVERKTKWWLHHVCRTETMYRLGRLYRITGFFFVRQCVLLYNCDNDTVMKERMTSNRLPVPVLKLCIDK